MYIKLFLKVLGKSLSTTNLVRKEGEMIVERKNCSNEMWNELAGNAALRFLEEEEREFGEVAEQGGAVRSSDKIKE